VGRRVGSWVMACGQIDVPRFNPVQAQVLLRDAASGCRCRPRRRAGSSRVRQSEDDGAVRRASAGKAGRRCSSDRRGAADAARSEPPIAFVHGPQHKGKGVVRTFSAHACRSHCSRALKSPCRTSTVQAEGVVRDAAAPSRCRPRGRSRNRIPRRGNADMSQEKFVATVRADRRRVDRVRTRNVYGHRITFTREIR